MNSLVIPRSIARQMTGIEWTDFTGNGWIGCTRIMANSGGRSGCEICYAATFAETRLGLTWGPGQPRRPVSSFSARMRRLDRLAETTGLPFSVFSLSLGDWLDPEVDAAMRDNLIETVESCTHLTWLLLTHRPHLARKLLPSSWRTHPPVNIWSGVTIDHPLHNHRWIPHCEYWAHTGRAWISAEPLAASLNPVVFGGFATIIFGGASGTSDPTWEFNPDWVHEAVDRYGEDKVFFKQYGDFRDGKRVGKRAAGRDVQGHIYDHTPWPRHREVLKLAANA
jgi:protein gp37